MPDYSLNKALDQLRRTGEMHGLNLMATVPASRYDDRVLPQWRVSSIDSHARGVVLIGNGGRDFWRTFIRHCNANRGWIQHDNPLDDFTRHLVEGRLMPLFTDRGIRCRAVYPFDYGGPTLNFLELARVAGLGGPSLLGVLVHPRFGPWIAFRAALLIDEPLDQPGEALGFDPCPDCQSRSCIAACPVNAVTYPNGWNVPKCAEHRVKFEADCASRCHSRYFCVLGPEHRYSDDELQYHQERALRVMRAYYLAKIKPVSGSS